MTNYLLYTESHKHTKAKQKQCIHMNTLQYKFKKKRNIKNTPTHSWVFLYFDYNVEQY